MNAKLRIGSALVIVGLIAAAPFALSGRSNESSERLSEHVSAVEAQAVEQVRSLDGIQAALQGENNRRSVESRLSLIKAEDVTQEDEILGFGRIFPAQNNAGMTRLSLIKAEDVTQEDEMLGFGWSTSDNR